MPVDNLHIVSYTFSSRSIGELDHKPGSLISPVLLCSICMFIQCVQKHSQEKQLGHVLILLAHQKTLPTSVCKNHCKGAVPMILQEQDWP